MRSEDDAELGGVVAGGGEDLPAAGLEVVGDGAVAGHRNAVARRRRRPELEHRDVRRPPRHLHRPVQSGTSAAAAGAPSGFPPRPLAGAFGPAAPGSGGGEEGPPFHHDSNPMTRIEREIENGFL
uniref:Uncharacterized protein n=1 Tax=Ananas comosus var. bracteatus TaxID=296719 RepID=A0A6V7PEL9_ANACO|nr:unnamed protein product [Ananas comosus var. bracteatus]